MRRASLTLSLLAATAAAQPPPAKAPAAGTIRVEAPAGLEVAVPAVPSGPAFAEPRARWWKSAAPCPRGSKPVRSTNQASADWERSLDCVRGEAGEGPFVLLRKDGSRFREGFTVGGKPHGLEREWFADGTLKRVVHYAAGKRHGPYREQLRDGTLFQEGAYLDDKKHGLWSEGTDWGFVARGYYARGDEEGRWVAELKNVTVASIGYAKGAFHGEARLWRLTGEPLATATFTNGDGTWTSLYRSGARASSLSCKGGHLVDGTWFDERGKKLDDLRSIDARPLSSSERFHRGELDGVCRASPVVLFTSRAFAPDR